MIRLINISLGVALVILIGALYHIRYSAEGEARALRKLERQIAVEHDRQRTLRAEWSSLNDPRRLQLLSRQYLELETIRPSQIIDLQPRRVTSIPILMPQPSGGADEPR